MIARAMLFAVLGASLFSGCGTCSSSAGRSFLIGHDGFAFTNELVWRYEWGPNGAVSTSQADPPPSHPHRCFPMTRAAREFFYHARFEPAQAPVDREDYRQRVRAIVARSSRCPSLPEDRIAIPGYADLHAFSSDHADLLRAECGGRILSFLQRGNWRMVFPVSQRQNRKTANDLVRELKDGRLPIVHVYQFPNTKLNHAILLHDVDQTGTEMIFRAYDPNEPARPATLRFDPATATFDFERNQYFGGGPVRVYEVYRGICY